MKREAVIVEAGKSDRLDDRGQLPDGAARGGVSGAATQWRRSGRETRGKVSA